MTHYPHVLFDLRHGSLEVLLRSAPAVGTVEFDDAHLVDIDAEERAVSFEVLTLDDLKIAEMAAEFGFTDQVPAIHAALDSALSPQTGTTVFYGATKIIQGTRVAGLTPQVQTDESAEAPEVLPLMK